MEYRYVQGKLYIRKAGDEKKLEFEEPGDRPFHTHSIARLLHNETAELYTGGWTEFMRKEEGEAEGGKITRRPASNEDIRQFIARWGGGTTLKDLLEYVEASKLDEEEKARIRRFVNEVTVSDRPIG